MGRDEGEGEGQHEGEGEEQGYRSEECYMRLVEWGEVVLCTAVRNTHVQTLASTSHTK